MKAANVICPICSKEIYGTKNLHHVFGGAYKSKSEKYKYLYNLHPLCHRELHDNPNIEKRLKRYCQERFEENHTREEFIKEFGKSYL